MNERIRELAEEAGIAVWGDAVYMYNPKDTLDSAVLEKFAKLIVRECAEMVRIQNEQFMENESHYGVVSTDVLKHFGVEE